MPPDVVSLMQNITNALQGPMADLLSRLANDTDDKQALEIITGTLNQAPIGVGDETAVERMG